MSFDAAVQPYYFVNEMEYERLDPQSLARRQKWLNPLIKGIRSALEDETNISEPGKERVGECACHFHLDTDVLLGHTKEYCVGLEENDLDAIYREEQQTRFNQIIGLPQCGIYVPQYFFFPLWVQIKELRQPVFVGSTQRLQEELKIINKSLAIDPRLVAKIPTFMMATERDLEDYGTLFSGDSMWVSLCYAFLSRLADASVENDLPILVNLDTIG